jgi:hypothetical protein
MERGRIFCLIAIGLTLWPGTPHANPENTFQKLFNPSFNINFSSEPTRTKHDLINTNAYENPFRENDFYDDPEDYLQVAFDYINRKLGLTDRNNVSLKPVVGLDLHREFTVGAGMTLTPEVYAIYRYESLDEDMPLFEHHSVQAGVGLAFKMSDTLSAHFSWDSDIITGGDQRAALIMKYRY